MRTLLCWMLVLAFSVELSHGQCCSGGVPIAGNLSLPGSESGELQVQLTYDYNRLRDLFNRNTNLLDNTRQRSTHSVLLETSYGFRNGFSVVGLFSFVSQERIIETLPGQRGLTRATGIGDLVLLLRKNLINRDLWGLNVGLGPKLPLGRNDLLDANSLELAADLQPGSGAWDAMFWLSFSRYRLFHDRVNFNLVGTGRLTGQGQRLEGRQSYEFGDELQFLFGFNDRFLAGQFLLDPFVLLRFRQVGVDWVNELPLPNTGGSFLHFVPGVSFLPSKDVSIRLAGEIPVFRFVQGTQLATSQRVTLSLFWRINAKNQAEFQFDFPQNKKPSYHD